MSSLFASLFGKKEVRILILGLDNAGKTTILCACGARARAAGGGRAGGGAARNVAARAAGGRAGSARGEVAPPLRAAVLLQTA